MVVNQFVTARLTRLWISALLVVGCTGATPAVATVQPVVTIAPAPPAATPAVTARPVTAPPVVIPAPTAVPAPKVLLDVKGSGTKKTKRFEAPADYTIAYSFDCTAFGSSGNFQIYVTGPNGMSDVAANELAKSGSSSTEEHDAAGSTYLEMNSECDWHVKVTG